MLSTGSTGHRGSARTAEFLRIHLGARDHEVFGLLHLNNRLRLIAVEDLFRGTLTEPAVYPREVIKSVLSHGSAAVILYHNHPSGTPEPSASDKVLTRKLKRFLAPRPTR
jgi:DNA repair protein RadC